VKGDGNLKNLDVEEGSTLIELQPEIRKSSPNWWPQSKTEMRVSLFIQDKKPIVEVSNFSQIYPLSKLNIDQ